MPALVLDGRKTAAEIRLELSGRIGRMRELGVSPKLTLIRVGEDPASIVYVRNKTKACAETGIESQVVVLPEATPEEEIARTIEGQVADPSVHGVLLQLPLPGSLDPVSMLMRIAPEKDVDGFHPVNIGRLCLGSPLFIPCTPLGILELIRRNGIDLAGRHVAVIGRSTTVGRPLANLLSMKARGCNATVSLLHTGSHEPWRIARTADVVVAAAGHPGLVDAGWVRPGAVVVDVGIHRGADGRLTGDVDARSVSAVAGWLSPVPGGVGPMTVACLLLNTVQAAERLSGVAR